MRILSYNIDHGGLENKNPRYRWPKIVRAVKHARPDILVILEAWGWRKNIELAMFAKKLGYKYFFLSPSNTQHHIALLSNIRPKNINFYTKGFHHSCIHAYFKSKSCQFGLLGVHLSPVNEELRLREAKKIIRIAKKHKRVIIIGDFNSLSPNDQYNKIRLIKLFRKNNITKFGNKRIETRVMKKFFQSGFVDAVKLFSNKGIRYTAPTQRRTSEKYIARLRYDYALVSRALCARIHRAREIKNSYTNTASDHYPIVIELRE